MYALLMKLLPRMYVVRVGSDHPLMLLTQTPLTWVKRVKDCRVTTVSPNERVNATFPAAEHGMDHEMASASS